MGFQKAIRKKVWIKVELSGTSGSGKTMSALRVATGIYDKCGGEGIAFISSEGSRSLYYADKYNYDILELEDHSPEKYMEAIDEAIRCGYKVIIIDSSSHEWQWLNDLHSKMKGNSFTNWAPLKARHKLFVNKILQCPAHVIVCARSKTEWVLEDKNGKQVPKKAGLGIEGDKQFDYEFTVALSIDQGTHIASVEDGGKDNTGMFDQKYEVLTEKHGEMLYNWANSGEGNAPEVPAQTYQSADVVANIAAEPVDELKEIKRQIVARCTQLGGTKHPTLMSVLKGFVPSGNPNAIRDIDKAKECLEAVNTLE